MIDNHILMFFNKLKAKNLHPMIKQKLRNSNLNITISISRENLRKKIDKKPTTIERKPVIERFRHGTFIG